MRGKVEIPLPPGLHRVTARLDFLRSQPLEIDADPEGVHHLLVGSNMNRRMPWKLALYSAMWTPLALVLLNFARDSLFSDPLESVWFSRFMIPVAVLPGLLLLTLMIVRRDHILFLEEISHPEGTGPLAFPPGSQPPRVPITIRDLMVAVAVLAILLAAGIEWTRFTRRDFFLKRANSHSQGEAQFRDFEEVFARMAADSERLGLDAAPTRRSEARSAARADYHTAMKRKYEDAAARRRIAIEPDPPEPPWP